MQELGRNLTTIRIKASPNTDKQTGALVPRPPDAMAPTNKSMTSGNLPVHGLSFLFSPATRSDASADPSTSV